MKSRHLDFLESKMSGVFASGNRELVKVECDTFGGTRSRWQDRMRLGGQAL